MNGIRVAKFGGTSLADASQIRKVIDIIRADRNRQFIVVSAPGARFKGDLKITDLLIGLYKGINGFSKEQILEIIEERFRGIVNELGLQFDVASQINTIRSVIKLEVKPDFIISRGEYLSARILAEALGYEFIDAANIILIKNSGQLDMEATLTYRGQLTKRLGGCVIPGFYGSLPDGSIKTFARGGSDLSGAIVAALVDADLYENWTDVSGLLMADPEVVPNAKRIDTVTYRELRELTYMGARVLHDEVIFPLRGAGVPIWLGNTNRPYDRGTMIVPDTKVPQRKAGSIVGIAGRKNFTVITLEKTLMNQEVGFIRRACGVFEQNGINIEHIPGGIDTLSIVIASESLDGKLDRVKKEIGLECQPDNINVDHGFALICMVGHAIAHTPGVLARLSQAVASAGVNVRMVDQGSSEISIIIGVLDADYEKTVCAIYNAFVK